MDGGTKRWSVILGFGTVVLLGIGTFTLAMTTFATRLRAPFGLPSPSDLENINFTGNLEESLLAETKDTDRDGIPDVQELQIYKTSPFLEDTDSDGVSDKGEIDVGEDPNCPRGVDCRRFAFPSAKDAARSELVQKLYETTVSSRLAQGGIPGLTDAHALRTFLKQAGISDDILNQFDDEVLVQIFNQATGTPPVTPPTPPERSATPAGLPAQVGAQALPRNPTPEAVRELLMQGGISKSLLEGLSDEQLLKLYEETLSEVNKKQ